jgi:phospholipase/carboxylesterase
MLAGPERLGEATARDVRGARPPVLLVHGDQDQVIPLEAMFLASEELAKADIPNQWHLSIGVGHGIDNGGLRHGGLFIAKGFGLKVG